MKKLIVKSRIDDTERIIQQFAGMGMDAGPTIWQHERVYLPHEYRSGRNLPRLVLRTEVKATDQPAEYSMYLKRHIEDSGVDWINQTRVVEYTEAAGMIHQLGFKKVAEVSRQRREIMLDDRTVVYLDIVEGLGAFVKIEAEMDEREAVEALRVDLFNMLKMLGQTSFVMQSYFELLSEASEDFEIPRD